MNDNDSLPIRVLIVDDHVAVRQGLEMLLRQETGFDVVGSVGSGDDALGVVDRCRPDVVLLDVNLGGGRDGIDLLKPFGEVATRPKVLIWTGSEDVGIRSAAFEGGAYGLILKTDPVDEVIKAIRKVHQGELCFQRIDPHGPAATRPHRPQLDDERVTHLTRRERELIALLAEGLSNDELAQRLFISTHTVRNHLTSIFTKLGVQDRLQLAVLAYRIGLAKLPD